MLQQAQTLLGCYIAEKFRVDAVVTADATAALYVATDAVLGRVVALKIFWIFNNDHAEAFGRMQREAMILTRTEHPNTRRIHDAGRDPTSALPFIAMEWIPGQSLRTLLHLPVSTDQFLRLARDMTGGLAAAHHQGIAHGSLNTDSVVITTEPSGELRARLLQLGASEPLAALASALASPDALPQAAFLTAYLAPEQRAGLALDARTDVYAVGAILYHVLSGNIPAPNGGTVERLKPRAGMEVPLLLEALIMRCLHADPARRFQDGRELYEVFSNLLRDGGSRSHDGIQAITVDPLSRFVVIGRIGGRIDVFSIESGAQLAQFKAHRGAVNALLFRPESDEFLSAGEDGHIHLWGIGEKVCKGTWPGLRGSLYALAFSPLRYIFASGEIDGRVRLWSLSQQGALGEFQAHTGPVTALHFLPEGRFLASGGRDGFVRLWDIGSMSLAETCPWQRGSVVGLSMRVRDRFVAAFEDGSMALGRWDRQEPQWHHRIHRHTITHLFQQDGGQGVLSLGLDGVINSVDQFDGDFRRAPLWLLEGVRAAFLHPRTETLYCSSDSLVMRWRWLSGQPQPTLEGFLAPDCEGWQRP